MGKVGNRAGEPVLAECEWRGNVKGEVTYNFLELLQVSKPIYLTTISTVG